MDKFRALTVFRRVIELGSFKQAAEDLQLSKAAVSKNINELEDYLKTPLINRTTRKMHITEQGEKYYHQVRDLLDELNNTEMSILDATSNVFGHLKISMPMSFGLVNLNQLICEFCQIHPDLNVEIVLSDKYVDLVEQGVDIAIRGGKLASSSLRSRKLFTIERILCASPDYLSRSAKIKHPQDIKAHNCLVYTLSSSPRQWQFHQNGNIQEVEFQQSNYTVNSSIAIKQALLAGLGLSLIPKDYVLAEIASGNLVEVLPTWQAEKHALYAVYPSHKEQSLKIRALIDFLVEKFDL